MCVCSVAKSRSTLKTPWTVAREAPPSMGFSRQEYWSGLPFPPPVDLPDPGIEPLSLTSPAMVRERALSHTYSTRQTSTKLYRNRVINFFMCILSHFSHAWLFAILWTEACHAPLSMGFSRQEYWSGLPFPPPGHLSSPGMEPTSLTSTALANEFFTTSTTWEAPIDQGINIQML